ncbi:MAG: hypothetical protein E7570_07395 [Ruminococcaceae bacterium]|nr:hypothetical protein [Oscillospiraceae bacterium]
MAEDKEIKDLVEKKEKSKKAKKEKKAKTKQQKCAIVLGIILVVLFVLTLGTKIAINPNMPTYNNYAYMIMPKSIKTVFDDKEMTLYIEKNKDYDKTKHQPLEAFKVYYYEDDDTSKEKIYLKNGITLKGEKEESNLMVLQFLTNGTLTDSIIRAVLNRTLIGLSVLLGIYLIFVWYVVWSMKYDKQHK